MKTRLLLVVLALGVTLTAQTPDPSTLPLLQSGALQYIGAFRLPTDTVNGSNFTLGGKSMAFNPATNSIYISSGESQAIAEVNIPAPLPSSVVNDLPYATLLQPFADPSEGHIAADMAGAGLTGLMVYGNRLYGTATIWYDANNTQRVSHFSRSLKLDQPSFSGWSAVWQDIHSAFVSGFMAPVPSEWQAKLGGPALTGQCCVSIVSRTSNGPAAFSFDPAKVGQPLVSANPLVYYTVAPGQDTLGPWEGGSNPTYGATTYIRGMAVIAGTRTALYLGNNGMGLYCYGNGTADQSLAGTPSTDGSHYCYDPTESGKGQHAYPYRYQAWAYDLNDLAAVKAGTKQPWEIKPYGVWPLDLPTPSAHIALGGVGYDAARQIIYVAQLSADNNNHVIAEAPIVHAFKVNVSTTTPSTQTTPTDPTIAQLKAVIAVWESRVADIKATLQTALPMPSNTKTTVKNAVTKALALASLPAPALPPPVVTPPAPAVTEVLSPARRSPYWTTAGAGPIPARLTVCATITAYAGPGDAINTAIQNCPAGQTVELGAGTFNLSSGVRFENKANVTVRGAGPDKTILKINGASGGECATQYGLCIAASGSNYPGQPQNTANWTAGYAVGSNVITLSSTTNLQVDSVLILDQLDDPNTDNGGYWNCQAAPTTCASSGASGVGRAGRGQQFVTKVTGISGTQITLADPLIQPNWRSDRSPGAWWMGSGAPRPVLLGIGIENLTLDYTHFDPAVGGALFYNCNTCWFKNVRSIALEPSTLRANTRIVQSAHVTIRDSYFYNHQGATANYGIEMYTTSNVLVENNITECTTGSIVTDASVGNVYAYNYSKNNCYVNYNWMQPSYSFHSPGNAFILLEGNSGTSFQLDDIHGTANFITAFRNRLHGWENGKTAQTVPAFNYAYSRYTNIIGNVLGTVGYHDRYQSVPGDPTCWSSIYALGWSGNCQPDPNALPNDARLPLTIMRWGNYDTVTGAARFVDTEVATADAYFPNAKPANQVLPPSLYLSAQPAWWSTPWGTPAFPAIGPDVTSGDEPDIGGHADSIPAKRCFEHTAVDPSYAVSYTVTAGSYANGEVTLTIGAHPLKVGNAMQVSGLPAAYNGSFLIKAITATTVTYGLLTNPGPFAVGGVVKSPNVLLFNADRCYGAP